MDDILDLDKSHNTRVNNGDLKSLAKKEEPRFLSILLKDMNSLMDAVSYGIKPGDIGHFWLEKPRFLYMIILEYYQKYGELLTRTAMESIVDSLSKSGKISIDDDERTSARMYYDEVYGLEAPVSDYKLLRDHINSRYVQWQGFEIMKAEMEGLVKSTSGQDEQIRKIKEKFLSIDNLEADSYVGSLGMVEAMSQVRDYITDRKEHPENEPRVPTGIDALDKLYYLTPGSYTVISGMINGGKSTLMFNIGFNMAKAGHSVCYVSIEKEAMPIMIRLTSLHALVDYNRIKRGGDGDYGLSEPYYQKLMEATKDLEENICPNFECVQAVQGTKLSKIFSEVDKYISKREREGGKVDALIVDYLGVIGFETRHEGRNDLDEAEVSKRLQAYGRKNKLVTIVGSQLKTPSSKEIRNKSKKASADDPSSIEINTEDLAGSKMIIADADNGLSAVLNGDSPPTKMFVYGTKARDDQARMCVVLDFDGKIGSVTDPEFNSGQITEVDNLLYDDEVSEEDLISDDGLFDDSIEDMNEVDFSFAESTTTSTKKNSDIPEGLEDDELFEL